MTRQGESTRTTRETEVRVTVDLDGTGKAQISTGVGFFDHLLASLAHHSMIDLVVATTGDLEVDEHHTVEDTMLVLGQALSETLSSSGPVRRFASASVPMDEALATASVDVGGRPYAVIDLKFATERIGTLGTQMITHSLETLSRTAGITIHLSASGRNDHHVAEAAFKALAVALRTALEVDERRDGSSSTKGTM